jgi:hypothetical protein
MAKPKVTICASKSCRFTAQAKAFFAKMGISAEEREIASGSGGADENEILVNGRSLGGFMAVMAMQDRGELTSILAFQE